MTSVVDNLPQDITHWTITPDGFGGNTFSTPTVLKGRWEKRAELFRTLAGDQEVSRGIVFLSADVEINDYLFEGESAAADPTTLDRAEQVRQFHKIPDLRNLEHERRAIF